MPQIVLALLFFYITLICGVHADGTKTLIETSLLVNIDDAVEASKRRYSTSYQEFGKENLISQEIDNASTTPNSDLGASLDLIFTTLSQEELFNALDHSISYTCLLYTSPSPRDRG